MAPPKPKQPVTYLAGGQGLFGSFARRDRLPSGEFVSVYNSLETKGQAGQMQLASIQQKLFRAGYYGNATPNYGHNDANSQKAFANYAGAAESSQAGAEAGKGKSGRDAKGNPLNISQNLNDTADSADAAGLNNQNRQRMPRVANVVPTGGQDINVTGPQTAEQDLVNVFQDSLDQKPSAEETLKFIQKVQNTQIWNQTAGANAKDASQMQAAQMQDQAANAAEGAYNAGQSGGGGGVIESHTPNVVTATETPQASAEFLARTTMPEKYALVGMQKRMGDMFDALNKHRPGGTALKGNQ